jgi:hypothetical protein
MRALKRRGHFVERLCQLVELSRAMRHARARCQVAGTDAGGCCDERPGLPEDEEVAANPTHRHGQEDREAERRQVAKEDLVGARRRDRRRDADHHVETSAARGAQQRLEGVLPRDAVRGRHLAGVLAVVRHERVQDGARQRARVDPVARIRFADEHRSPVIENRHRRAPREEGLGREIAEPGESHRGGEHFSCLTALIDNRVGEGQRRPCRPLVDFVVADCEGTGVHRALEVGSPRHRRHDFPAPDLHRHAAVRPDHGEAVVAAMLVQARGQHQAKLLVAAPKRRCQLSQCEERPPGIVDHARVERCRVARQAQGIGARVVGLVLAPALGRREADGEAGEDGQSNQEEHAGPKIRKPGESFHCDPSQSKPRPRRSPTRASPYDLHASPGKS